MRRARLALAIVIVMSPARPAAALPAQDVSLISDDVAEFGVFIEEGVEGAYDVAVDIDRIDRSVVGIRATGQDGGLVSAGRKSGRIRSAGRRRSG